MTLTFRPGPQPASDSTKRRARRNKASRSCLCLPFSVSVSSSESRSASTTSTMNPSPAIPAANPQQPSAAPAPAPSSSTPTVRTRILIISDTHGVTPTTDPPADAQGSSHGHTASRSAFHGPLPEADVVIHCGDLTKRSTIDEYRATVSLLHAARAPLKIAIAGNHDISLHESYYRARAASLTKNGRPDLGWLAHQLATNHDASALLSSSDTITYLEEGTRDFVLHNGARLRLFTSPWTPSYGGWAFQYMGPHAFDIPPDADVAVTHGPPRGVLDFASNGGRAGCEHLFRAVERARPRVHCYGHIHEAWGAYYGHWADAEDTRDARPDGADRRASFSSESTESMHSVDSAPAQVPPAQTMRYFDASKSFTLEDISMIKIDPLNDSEDVAAEKRQRYETSSAKGCRAVDVTPEGGTPVEKGRQTMFLNAAILDRRYRIGQFPWMLEIDLPRA